MVVKVLSENTALTKAYEAEHGFSLYIETQNHKALFDMGETGVFLRNAQKLNVNIADVDIAFLSHGHSDHGGGLRLFLENNQKAPVYMHQKAFGKYYIRYTGGEMEAIGLDESLKGNARFIMQDGYLKIDEEMEIYSGVTGRAYFASSNSVLLAEDNGEVKEDLFLHEQNLVITQNGKTLLLAGCAHNGIINILSRFHQIKNHYPDAVISGFHLINYATGKSEEPQIVKEIGTILKNTGAKFYTCHCTGIEAFNLLKETMGSSIEYAAAGSVLEI